MRPVSQPLGEVQRPARRVVSGVLWLWVVEPRRTWRPRGEGLTWPDVRRASRDEELNQCPAGLSEVALCWPRQPGAGGPGQS